MRNFIFISKLGLFFYEGQAMFVLRGEDWAFLYILTHTFLGQYSTALMLDLKTKSISRDDQM
jgi:hypothetical protein